MSRAAQRRSDVAEIKAAEASAGWCGSHALTIHPDGRLYCDACRVNVGGYRVQP